LHKKNPHSHHTHPGPHGERHQRHEGGGVDADGAPPDGHRALRLHHPRDDDVPGAHAVGQARDGAAPRSRTATREKTRRTRASGTLVAVALASAHHLPPNPHVPPALVADPPARGDVLIIASDEDGEEVDVDEV
jgi:hypothetical protein